MQKKTSTFISTCKLISLLLSSFAIASTVSAQSGAPVNLRAAAMHQDVHSVGAAAIAGSAYEGAKDSWNLLVPYADYQWKNGWFAGVTNGVGYDFSDSPSINIGMRITPDIGRKESRSTSLKGMGDIKPSAEFGGFFNYHLGREFSIKSSLSTGYGDDRKGALAYVGLAYMIPATPNLLFGVDVGTSYVNQAYMQSYFGVTPQQSSTSHLMTFSPKAGMKDGTVNVHLTYAVSRDISLTFATTQTFLMNDAKVSPLTKVQNRTTGVIAVSYQY